MPKDHRIEVYLDAPAYIAIRARSEEQDRTLSQHIRHLIKRDLEESLASEADYESGLEGKEGGAG